MSEPICISEGHAFFFVAAAVAKRALAEPMKAHERLRMLEALDRMIDSHFTAEMLKLIEPASDAELAMVREARSLDPKEIKRDDPSLPPSIHLIAKSLDHFARLNVGIRSVKALYSAGKATLTTTGIN
jgi:hypothetical protein